MKEFKIRCSAISQIMGQPRSKAEKEAGELSQTAKTYCQTWLKEQIYSRRREFATKYTDKGLIVEDNSIDFAADYLGLGMLLKNDDNFSNDFMTGTPDVILNDAVFDVKNSWDCFTFPLFDDELPNKDYYWQMQGYMELCDKPAAKLIYTLMDTPIHLIEKEAYWYAKNNGYDEVDTDMYNSFVDKMTYTNIPDKYRIKIFDIQKNDQDIELIKEQVIKCRMYIKTLTNGN